MEICSQGNFPFESIITIDKGLIKINNSTVIQSYSIQLLNEWDKFLYSDLENYNSRYTVKLKRQVSTLSMINYYMTIAI